MVSHLNIYHIFLKLDSIFMGNTVKVKMLSCHIQTPFDLEVSQLAQKTENPGG